MQLAPLATFRPSPRPSADHAAFDVLAFRDAMGAEQRIGLVPRSRFWQLRGGEAALDDAIASAQQLAARTGEALAILAAHPGMLFAVPVYHRTASPDPRSAPVTATLDALAGATLTGRHGRVLAVVGDAVALDLRDVPPALGSGRG